MTPPLRLYEEVLLLSLHDERGTLESKNAKRTEVAVATAAVIELVLDDRLGLDGSSRAFLELYDASPTEDPVLDEVLGVLADIHRARDLKSWIARLSRIPNLLNTAATRLVAEEVLRAEQSTFLLVFERSAYPEVDHSVEAHIIERLRTAIFTDGSEVDDRTVVLVRLAQATALLDLVFGADAVRARADQIARLTAPNGRDRRTTRSLAALHQVSGVLAGDELVEPPAPRSAGSAHDSTDPPYPTGPAHDHTANHRRPPR